MKILIYILLTFCLWWVFCITLPLWLILKAIHWLSNPRFLEVPVEYIFDRFDDAMEYIQNQY